MGAYTWTFIRIDKLNKDQIKSCVEHAIWLNSGGNTYAQYSKMTEEEYISKWLELHKKHYDYFVKECDVDPNELTDEYLTQEIKEKMKQWFYNQECYKKVLEGTMDFIDMLYKTNKITDKTIFNDDFYIIKRGEHYFVKPYAEIFRNYEYAEDEYNTVDSLIEHLKDPKLQYICDITKDSVQPEYGPLSEKLKQKIIDYYTNIGDYNFVVQFG